MRLVQGAFLASKDEVDAVRTEIEAQADLSGHALGHITILRSRHATSGV